MEHQPTLTKAGQRMLTRNLLRRTIKIGLLPVLHLASKPRCRKDQLGPRLDSNSSTFQSRSSTIVSLLVAIIEFGKQTESRPDLQVSLTKHLTVTYIEH